MTRLIGKTAHEQMHSAQLAAHGLSGLIAGLAGGFERTDKRLGIPRSSASDREAKSLITRHNKNMMVSSHKIAFHLWQLWRDIIRLQHFNPVYATSGDVVDQAKTVAHARGKAIRFALKRLREDVAELEKAEKECNQRC